MVGARYPSSSRDFFRKNFSLRNRSKCSRIDMSSGTGSHNKSTIIFDLVPIRLAGRPREEAIFRKIQKRIPENVCTPRKSQTGRAKASRFIDWTVTIVVGSIRFVRFLAGADCKRSVKFLTVKNNGRPRKISTENVEADTKLRRRHGECYYEWTTNTMPPAATIARTIVTFLRRVA